MRLTLMGRIFFAGVATALALTACSGSKSDSTTATSGDSLEKPEITVGALLVPDAAPLHIALERGFFKEEGLTVKHEPIQGAALAVPRLQAGTMDVAMLNYITIFTAQEKNVGRFKFIADGYQGAPNTFVLMVPGDSTVKTPADLKGKKIAVATLNSIGTLTTEAALKSVGVDAKRDGIEYTEIPLPNMLDAMKSHQVDAYWMTEPFISASQKTLGARQLLDTMSGPTADLPVSGWGVTEEFAAKHPNTVAAFQRAMAKAQQIAADDRKAVEKILPKYTRIDEETAAVIALGTYPTTLNETRLQRVADLMLEHGYLQSKLEVKPLIQAPPGS